MILFLICIGFIYRTTNSVKFKLENMAYSDKVNFLTKGDTLFANTPKIKFYARYKSVFDKEERIVESGKDSISVAGLFVKEDSASGEYGGKYEKYFEVKPLREPTYEKNILFEQKDRVNKKWFVDPSDVNIGKTKFHKP